MAESVTVGVRIRPLNSRELSGKNNGLSWGLGDINTVARVDIDSSQRISSNEFQFDSVFDKTSSNEDVYTALGAPVVDAALGGFNGTIFAYGQTSSGKTHSMLGAPNDPGITPRAIQQVLDTASKSRARTYLVRAVYVEIYNDKIRDLLNPSSADLSIRQDNAGRTFVDAQETLVETLEDAMGVLDRGQSARAVGHTNMNAHSSRSHTVFTLLIESKAVDGLDASFRASSLNLVDLAGSERLKSTGAAGTRQKEGCHINQSLLTLGTIINRLSAVGGDVKKAGHLPYRDSKLTRLLQPALGGNARTAVLCAITPATAHVEETLSTLKFAARAKKVTTNATRNEVIDYRAKYKEASEEMQVLRERFIKMEKEIAALRGATYPGGLPQPPPTPIPASAPRPDNMIGEETSASRSETSILTPPVTSPSPSESVSSPSCTTNSPDSSPSVLNKSAETGSISSRVETPLSIDSSVGKEETAKLMWTDASPSGAGEDARGHLSNGVHSDNVFSERSEAEVEANRAKALRAARDEVKYLKAHMDEVESENDDLKARLRAKAKDFVRLHARAVELRTAARKARANEQKLWLAVKEGYEKLEEARKQLEQSRKKGAHVKVAENVLEELSKHLKQFSVRDGSSISNVESNEVVVRNTATTVTETGSKSQDKSVNLATGTAAGLSAATELALRYHGGAAAQVALRGRGSTEAATHVMLRAIHGDAMGGANGMRWSAWAMKESRGSSNVRRPRPLPDDMVADIDDSESEPGSPAKAQDAHFDSGDDIVERRDSIIDRELDNIDGLDEQLDGENVDDVKDESRHYYDPADGDLKSRKGLHVVLNGDGSTAGKGEAEEKSRKKSKSKWRVLRNFYGYREGVYDQMMGGHKIENRSMSGDG